jgi:hypothetical protein
MRACLRMPSVSLRASLITVAQHRNPWPRLRVVACWLAGWLAGWLAERPHFAEPRLRPYEHEVPNR